MMFKNHVMRIITRHWDLTLFAVSFKQQVEMFVKESLAQTPEHSPLSFFHVAIADMYRHLISKLDSNEAYLNRARAISGAAYHTLVEMEKRLRARGSKGLLDDSTRPPGDLDPGEVIVGAGHPPSPSPKEDKSDLAALAARATEMARQLRVLYESKLEELYHAGGPLKELQEILSNLLNASTWEIFALSNPLDPYKRNLPEDLETKLILLRAFAENARQILRGIENLLLANDNERELFRDNIKDIDDFLSKAGD